MIQDNQDIARTLEQAVSLYQSGDLLTAEYKLRSILAVDVHQPQANYYLGSLLLESLRTLDSLPYFNTALESDPQQAEYWLSYIGALIDAAHYEDAKLVLSYGRDAGLSDEPVEHLEQLLVKRQSEQ